MNSSDELRKLRKTLGIAQIEDALKVKESDVIIFDSQPVRTPVLIWTPKEVRSQ